MVSYPYYVKSYLVHFMVTSFCLVSFTYAHARLGIDSVD